MTTAYDAPHDEIERPPSKVARLALGIVVLAMVAMWAWIYIWAPRDNPDRLSNRAFPEVVEPRCAALHAEIDELPFFDTSTTISEKADQVAHATELTERLVSDLEDEAASTTFDDPDDERLLDLWFGDWNAYLADRHAYVQLLRDAPADTPRDELSFTLTERSSGGFYTRTIEGFANVNDMSSCHVPTDI
ncbi:MAG: hypothetical protein DHS20C19_11420 [Acidimicrobiales bacterium]|nr:MAG: hypothetical protein DHS20C19_11420 [Acidimicrobiales bacterium]